MSLAVRAARADQVAEFRGVMSRAFGWEATAEREPNFLQIWEPERSFCAFDGTVMVGTSGAYSIEMTVPGGSLATAGTTMVSVLPTYRRQGALRLMMAAHLADVAEREEPMAALWASDSAIYGRFGYGLASLQYDLAIDPRHGDFHRLAPSPAPVELIDAGAARTRLPLIHDQVRLARPGFFRRGENWWAERWFADPPHDRDGATSLRFAVAEGDAGFLIYRQKGEWSEGHGAGELKVLDLMATTAQAWSGLWRLAVSHDLITKVVAENRPADDPLFDLLAARRRAVSRPTDALWVRLCDLPAALAARVYQLEGRITFGVIDPFLDRRVTVMVESDSGGSVSREVETEPDLALDLEDLSACYMGWSRFRDLAALGRITGDQATLLKADLMFGWSPGPWCPEIF